MNIRKFIILASVLLTVIPVTVASLVFSFISFEPATSTPIGATIGQKQLDQLIDNLKKAQQQAINNGIQLNKNQMMVSIDTMQKQQVADKLTRLNETMLQFLENQRTVSMMLEFNEAYTEVVNDDSDIETMRTQLRFFYQNDFAQYFKQKTGQNITTATYVDALTPESVVLQYRYIQANPNPITEKYMYVNAADDSTYSFTHAKYHSHAKDFLQKHQLYNIYLVTPDSGDIIYSVRKEIDFTTSLLDGPFAESSLGAVYKQALTLKNSKHVMHTDIAKHLPSFNENFSFMAHPIYNLDETVGIAIFQLAEETLSEPQKLHEKWSTIIAASTENNALKTPAVPQTNTDEATTADTDIKNSTQAESATPPLLSEQSLKKFLSVIIVFASLLFAIPMGIGIYNRTQKPISQINVVLAQAISSNDLTARVNSSSDKNISALSTHINTLLNQFQDSIQKTQAALGNLNSTTQQVINTTYSASDSLAAQQSRTDQVATAMEQMTASVHEVERSAKAAALAAQDADNQATEGKQTVNQTIQAIEQLASDVERGAGVIHELESHSDSIGSVLDVIKGIAEQTNLLALNAAIEAARAGEQGRGFAVVADEVRTLASRTQDSTTEIQTMIEQLQQGALKAVQVMKEGREQANSSVEQTLKAGAALEAITTAVTTINEMNTQIASAASEQKSVADDISNNICSIRDNTDQTVTSVQEAANSTQQLDQQTSTLSSTVKQYKA